MSSVKAFVTSNALRQYLRVLLKSQLQETAVSILYNSSLLNGFTSDLTESAHFPTELVRRGMMIASVNASINLKQALVQMHIAQIADTQSNCSMSWAMLMDLQN